MDALETYLDFLETSSSNSGKENRCTPRIDAVLHQYRQRETQKKVRSDEQDVRPGHSQYTPPIPLAEKIPETSYESRLIQLEEQLTDLLARSSSKVQKSDSKDFTTSTPQKELVTDSDVSLSTPPKPRPLALSARTEQPPGRRYHRGTRKRTGSTVKVSSMHEDRRKKEELLQPSKKPTKNDPSSLQVLTKELDDERERRWKAEQAAARLVEHVRTLQSRVEEEGRRHELAVVRATQVERELAGEQETCGTLQKQVLQLQDAASNDRREKEELCNRETQQIKLLHELGEKYRQLETEKLKEQTLLQSRVKESEAMAAGNERELEVLRKTLKQSEGQLQQLQEVLAKREEEHQKDMERYRPLDGREVQDLIAKQVQVEKEKTAATIDQLRLKIAEQEKAYSSLEEEFRMGLRIETGRFSELERSYQEVCGEVEATRQTAMAAVQKEKRAVGMIEELTAMVREQKSKIRELTTSKEETVATLKERVGTLETEVVDRNRLEARMLSLQEEKGKLDSQVTAQLSVIDGLRAERKLWGKELAHQGASLAQERGRMEAQLELLTKEASSLREALQRERDSLRVKEKQVEDQLHTIDKLKKEAAGRETEHQTNKVQLEKELKDFQFHLEQEEASNLEMQEQLASLLERKEKLKEDVASKLEEGDHWKTKFNNLNGQWELKVKIIDSLEQTLQEVQKSFGEREKQLVLEKDEALRASKESEQRLKACDDAFREQLEAKEKVYHDNLSRLAAEKDKEISIANEKVVSVEDEMRELLQELAREKRNMEIKVTQLTTVLQDLQKDFTSSKT